MDRQLVGALAVLVAVCAVAAVQAQPPSPKLPPNYHMINPGHMGGKRDQQLSCDDTQGKKKGCMAKCDKRCPNQCMHRHVPQLQDLLQ
ncbi:Os01g0968200 [Oryza sativa Japonica Group]|uniref:Os01g0968200 protein n=1 Tax=Oryza sativa subsp. japonica TaxID=39947 RepID=A0A0P0VDA1_ORYSJ|nr:Os01g0968200 [Oryza sativa Japonica Group]